MREVASQSFAPEIIRMYRDTADAVCPLCGRKTFHYDFVQNVAACPACSWGGGVLDTWALFKGFQGADARKQAARDIARGGQQKIKPLPKIVKENKMASSKKRNAVYSFVLDQLSLSAKHRSELKARGLTDEDIDFYGYKDAPTFTIKLERESKGVPGTYTKDGNWFFTKLKPGILIPERNTKFWIQGMQTRPDDGNPKYYTVSSDRKTDGTKATTFVHLANRRNTSLDKVMLTEGPLKADVISAFTGEPVLAIPGVSAQKNLLTALEALKEKGTQEIGIAFDMDFYTKETVQKALKDLKKKLSDLELEFVQLEWDARFKGYDDYLNGRL